MTNSSKNLSLDGVAHGKGLVLARSNGNGTRETEYHLWRRHRAPEEPTIIASYVNEDEARRYINQYDPEAQHR